MTAYAPSDPRSWTTGREVSLWLLSEHQRRQYKRWAARYDPARDVWVLPSRSLVGALMPRWEGSAEIADEVAVVDLDDETAWLDDDWSDDRFGRGHAYCMACGAEWSGLKVCHCATCHLTFSAVGGFDFHRIGNEDRGTRRCRVPDELRELGYEPNDRGQWRKPAPADLYVKER